MDTYTANEILINAHRINDGANAPDIYEFVIDSNLQVLECVWVQSLSQGIMTPMGNFLLNLKDTLFEMNHVRINPRLDNTMIIGRLTNALSSIGVNIYNAPSNNSMAICYRPLGEITENVRFYFRGSGECVFLCPNAKLKSVPSFKRM